MSNVEHLHLCSSWADGQAHAAAGVMHAAHEMLQRLRTPRQHGASSLSQARDAAAGLLKGHGAGGGHGSHQTRRSG